MTGDWGKNKKTKIMGPKMEALRFSLIYISLGFLWIILSDKILSIFVKDFDLYSHLQLYKGWFYVFITTILIFFLILKRGIIIKGAFDELRKAAYSDSLTGLPNKTAFLNSLEEYTCKKGVFYLAYIDLDNFRYINDTLGHKTGDEYLGFIAKGLSEVCKEQEFYARLGGDEFGIIFPSEAGSEKIQVRLEEISQHFGKFWKRENHQFFVSFSIGIARYPGDGTSASELYKNANIAMNKAKKSGKNTFVFFEEIHLKNVTENVEMANDLQEAIENEDLILHFQPVFNIITMEKVGFEALLRWKSKKRGFVSPDAFIPLAEETGQIMVIDRWVLNQVLKMKKQLEDNRNMLGIGINLSSKTLMDEVNFPYFLNIFDDYDVDFSGVTIEITETAIISDIDLAIERIKHLRGRGIKIALDDFGTGYSSLNHLKNLPIDIVKLDKSFVGSISENNRESLIIKAIISLSKSLGFEVIAEGIENEEQIKYLQKNGSPLGQGFYLQRPDSIDKVL